MPRVQWHHRAHETWGNQELIFWFLPFNSMYNPEKVLEVIKELLAEHGVLAFSCYEVMGLYDVLLRVWLPHGRRKAFEKSLYERLGQFGLRDAQFFEVEDVLRHWVWASEDNESGPPVEPTEEFLAAKPGTGIVLSLNNVGDLGDEGFDEPMFKLYADQNVIAAKRRVRGIRLITAIQPEPGGVPEGQIQGLGEALGETLDGLATVAHERALYFGRGGTMSRFLLTCTIDYGDYHRFRTEILTEIGAVIRARGPVRTLTFPVTSFDYLLFQDHLPHDRVPEPTIDELLQQDESQTLELKASAFSPLSPWLNRKEAEPVERPAYPNETILRAIASFLNSNDGTLIIGVMEASDYEQHSAVTGELPEVGPHRVLGLADPTFTANGKRGWDEFERKLQGVIAERIDPPPSQLLGIRHERCQGRDLCVVVVESPRVHKGYFVKDGGASRFYVRRGAAVKELHGPAVIEYLDERRERASRS